MVAFGIQEISNYFGRPSLLVTFRRGNRTWSYTSADRDTTLGGRLYLALPLKVGPLNQSGDAQSDEVTIELPADEGMVSRHIAVPPTEEVSVIIARYHKDGDDAFVRFVGQVDRVRRLSPLRAEVKCKTLLASYARSGARLSWQRGCTHALYDPGCKVNKALYGVPGVVASKNASAITATALAALADNRFQGGFLEWDFEPALKARRAITDHAGEFANILGGTYGIEVGMNFVAYPGCPRNIESCANFYDNLPNYGGIVHLPSKSPFNGNPVF
jgi:uncharacterized phage protein (TIGR02218 family)